ncbi:gamma-glutamylcyclotransferase family protein [Paenibacillus soyae]|uniref:Gamma-glutamylcyclotransferase n=1 Tax=Paenibacillus soyae TaxID=2969249 RepID=A0A9X2MMF9_9BACL|nr:gamma-glutamylcyclotransferase family protein [Paenibacillus soyae]MCR2802428.1 gamma-glutamylcyclotransferase [Paenibacillus soyae]
MSDIRVFIYGSLLPGHSNHHVVSSYVTSYEPGEIEGRLVDYGPYPAAVRDRRDTLRGTGTIRGQWITVGRAGLAAMDILEEFAGIEENNEYDRVWARDIRKPGVQGWVYVWESDRGYPAIEDSYWPDYWARKSG